TGRCAARRSTPPSSRGSQRRSRTASASPSTTTPRCPRAGGGDRVRRVTAAPRPHAAPPDPAGTEVLVAGPASWNLLVRLDELPAPTPHTAFARSSHHAVGGTSAGKALNLARLGRTVLLRTVLGSDDEAEHVRSVLARE